MLAGACSVRGRETMFSCCASLDWAKICSTTTKVVIYLSRMIWWIDRFNARILFIFVIEWSSLSEFWRNVQILLLIFQWFRHTDACRWRRELAQYLDNYMPSTLSQRDRKKWGGWGVRVYTNMRVRNNIMKQCSKKSELKFQLKNLLLLCANIDFLWKKKSDL